MECRICKSETKEFLDLGCQPLANNLSHTPNDTHQRMYELRLAFCPICCTVQLVNTVSPRDMFNSKYPFFTSSSEYMVRHFGRLATLIQEEYMEHDDFIVEIGSNDGTFLKNFREYCHLGIEPSPNVAEKAKGLMGLNVTVEFFNEELTKRIYQHRGKAKVIVSTNSFPHIEDRDSVLKGIKKLLSPTGLWINEEAYLGSIIANVSYDQFYNEHIYTSSVASFRNTVQRYGLELINAEYQSVHGGSMRYFVTHQSNAIQKLSHLRNIIYVICQENLADYKMLENFAFVVKMSKEKFLNTLDHTDGDIVGYGATAKCTTILNYCGLDSSKIKRIYDTTPEKQGLFIPGTDIRVVPHENFAKDKPKNVVLFAWNHAEEIFEKEKDKNINWIIPI